MDAANQPYLAEATRRAQEKMNRRYPHMLGVPAWVRPLHDRRRQEYNQLLQAELARLLQGHEDEQFAQQLQGVNNARFAQHLQGVNNAEIANQLQGENNINNVQQIQRNQNAQIAQQLQEANNAQLARQLQGANNGQGVPNNAQLARQLQGANNGQGVPNNLNRNISENIALAHVANVDSRNILRALQSTLTNTGPMYMVGFCPVCLLQNTKDDPLACNYVDGHNCLQIAGVQLTNRSLYRKYFEGINPVFCIECGRACNGHGHYTLTPSNNLNRPPIAPINNNLALGNQRGAFYVCKAGGGGGRRELVARMLGIRDTFARKVNMGNVVDSPALRIELSNAAEDYAQNLAQLQRADRVILARSFDTIIRAPRAANFRVAGLGEHARAGQLLALPNDQQAAVPIMARLLPELPQAIWAVAGGAAVLLGGLRAAGEGLFYSCAVRRRHNPSSTKVIVGGRCYLHDLLEEELDPGLPVYKFKHMNNPLPRAIPSLYEHPNDKLICLEHLTSHIQSKLPRENRNANDLPNLLCFVSGIDGCGGEIHPDEIKTIVPDELYRQYLALYNTFHPIAGGGKRNKKTLKKMNKKRQKKPGQKLSRCRRLN